MSMLESLLTTVRPLRGAPRWPYILPALVPLLFIGHALEDAGPGAAMVLGGLTVFCLMQAVWPTILGWVILFAPFLGFGIMVAASPGAGSLGEWILFLALGLGPAVLLWLGRPWKRVGLRNL